MEIASKAETKRRRREEQREAERRVQQQRALMAQRRHRRKWWIRGVATVAGLAAMAGAVLYVQNSSQAVPVRPVVAALGPPSSAVPGVPAGNFTRIDRVIRQNGKPELFYVGEMYCPYCAAERWSVVKALSQFGTWSHLSSTTNGKSVQGFAVIPTFDFMGATYRSKYVSLAAKDITDWDGKPLQSLSFGEQALFNRYNLRGGTPMTLAGDYVELGSGYSPAEIQGKSFASVQQALQRGDNTSFVAAINAETNVITAILCHADGGRPASTCTRPAIRNLMRGLH